MGICNSELSRGVAFFAICARAAERGLSEFIPQEVANTAWAFAKVKYGYEKVFAALATAAKRWLSEFNPQDAANNGMGICNRELPP